MMYTPDSSDLLPHLFNRHADGVRVGDAVAK
jgi:hypothetical protein